MEIFSSCLCRGLASGGTGLSFQCPTETAESRRPRDAGTLASWQAQLDEQVSPTLTLVVGQDRGRK